MGKNKSSKVTNSSRQLKSSEVELDIPAEILKGIGLFVDNTYYMQSYNIGEIAWTFGADPRGGFKAIPEEEVDLPIGEYCGYFCFAVCGYKALYEALIDQHKFITGNETAAVDFAADAVEYFTALYRVEEVTYCD